MNAHAIVKIIVDGFERQLKTTLAGKLLTGVSVPELCGPRGTPLSEAQLVYVRDVVRQMARNVAMGLATDDA